MCDNTNITLDNNTHAIYVTVFRRGNNMKHGMIEESNGTRVWYYRDKLHRADGPAAELANGDRMWYCHGKLHRADGPAIEWADGDREWYLNDKQYTFAEWLQHNPTLDSKTRILYALRYSEEVA